ncbi:outer membrane protein assembly factor BamB family protein [Cellulomonas sp. NPDC055163]
MSRDPMVEVELVAAPAQDPGSAPEAGRAEEPRRRVRTRTVVVAGAVLVAALVGTQSALDARERAEMARYAEVPGVLPPLGDGLEARWEPGLGDVLTLYAGAEVGGLGLGARFEDSGAQSAVALDPATGDVRWSTPLRGPEELLVDAVENLQAVPCDATTGEAPLLVCLVGGRYERPSVPPESYGGDTSLPTPVPREADLVVLDATTGEVVRRTPEQPRTGMLVAGGTVVTASCEHDGSVVVRARDVRTGGVAWEQALPAGTAEREWARAGAVPYLVPAGDTVVVVLGTAVVLLGPDGTLTGTAPASASATGSVVQPARGDRVVRRGLGISGGTADSLLAPDGTVTALPEGSLRPLTVDDGSEPDVLLLTGAPDADGGLLAWDAGTAEVRWAVDDLLVADAVVLGGVAYLVGYDRSLRAVELEDGTTRWRTAPPSARGTGDGPTTSPSLLTDGRSLVVVARRAGATEARAYALRDGRSTWAGTLPFEVDGVQPLGGRAVAWSRDADRWTVLG